MRPAITAISERDKMDIAEIRRRNFVRLYRQSGIRDLKDFAVRVGIAPGHASQINNKRRNIGPTVARRIENALNLPKGYMDTQHREVDFPDKFPIDDFATVRVEPTDLAKVIAMIDDWVEKHSLALTSSDKAELVVLVVEYAKRGGSKA